jgi:prepilin-type N-terminal cleavage/methylation domain-containing protein
MESRPRSAVAKGFSLLEVLVALVLLGLITGLYMYTSHASQKNTGQSVDWQAEGVAIEKAIELLRTGHTLGQVQNFDSTWTDNSSRLEIEVHAKGGKPDASVCKGFDPDKLAKVTVRAHRTTSTDTLSITTYLWLN